MFFPGLFYRLREAGATEIELRVRPGYRLTSYRLTWTYAGDQYGYQYIVSDSEFAEQLHALDHIFAVLSDNAMISINHAKAIGTIKEEK